MTPLREKISEILIKHHMSTRQVAINEIIQAITELIEEAQPEKIDDSWHFPSKEYGCHHCTRNSVLDDYKSNLLKGVRG